jgi:beta-galactosidase
MKNNPIKRPGISGTLFLFLTIWITSCAEETPATREKLDFNQDWKFALEDSALYSQPGFDDSMWRTLDLPHDWSIEGAFSPDAPAGIGGGALPGGTGWYRKSFVLPPSDSLRRLYITFDGVYQNSEVYLNGQLLGKRPNGYIGFHYDLTPFLRYGTDPNILAVRVDNSEQPNSRWYSGSGIYRNVWLEKTHPIHISHRGPHITTPRVSEENAEVEIIISIDNTTSEGGLLTLETALLDHDNNRITGRRDEITIPARASSQWSQSLNVGSPELWSMDDPTLYRAVSTLKLDNKEIDTYETTFGIRYFHFDPEKGFSLNGVPTKILGVCNHHDLGALGTAVNERAIERQLEILREMGCNSIRTSHNPPAPELLDLCDRMGFLVMDETFDMWKRGKTRYDYSQYWDEWHVRDLTDHLLRDRNHPSVIIWSIGNEIPEQGDTTGTAIALELAGIVRELAPGVMVTSGCNHPFPGNYIIQSGTLDLIGFNYHQDQFEKFPETFPGKNFIASETTSAIQSRGSYDMPSDSIRIWPVRWDRPFTEGNPDQSCSAYDNCHVPWGSTHEESWRLIKKHDYLSGMYIWTGFDYLGEPTPYEWPSRSSYFGIIDLAGFPKDVYYMYQSEWTDKDVLHLLPHWNWKSGEEVDVWAYTSFPEVELFINGQSQGIRYKTDEDLHLQWRTLFQPGTLKAVGRRADGTTREVVVRTAGEPAGIILEADRNVISAGGKDLSYVTVTIVDRDNNPVPYADNQVQFEVTGNASIAGVDNGNQVSHQSLKGNTIKAYHGKCLVILKASHDEEEVLLTALSEGLEPGTAGISIRIDPKP